MNNEELNERIMQESARLRRRVSELDCYIQLAEEASELSQAARKMARRLRGGYVNKSDGEILDNVKEELTDILIVAMDVLGWDTDPNLELYKLQRWNDRLDGKIRDGNNS